MNLLTKLEKQKLIHPPHFLLTNTMYATIMGSNAYGVADTSVKKDKVPDLDIYGFGIPPIDYIFPQKRGEVSGFGTPGPKFDQWIQHKVFDKNVPEGISYDDVLNELKKRELDQ